MSERRKNKMAENTIYEQRTAPWSGIGSDIRGAKNVTEALQMSGLDWDIFQRPVATQGFNQIPVDGFKVNLRSTDHKPLGIVTDRYKPVSNREAFSFVDDLVDGGITFERAGQFQGGRRVWILARLTDRYIINGEAIAPYIVFISSHDGSTSIRVANTPIRIVCSNQLNLALRKAQRTFSVTHTGDPVEKLNEAKATLLYSHQYMNELGKEIEGLSKIRLSDAQVFSMVDKLLPVEEDMTEIQKKGIGRKRADLLERYMHAPDLESLPKNGYRFINAVSDHAMHADPLKKNDNYRENLFSKSIDGTPLLDKAYELVQAA